MPVGSLIDRMASELRAQWPHLRPGEVTVMVAVSGGADSVALLRILHYLAGSNQTAPSQTAPSQTAPSHRVLADRAAERKRSPPALWVAHYNHRLRGRASDEDQAFVENLAGQLNVPCVVGLPERASQASKSENDLRRERYDFLESQSHRVGARYLALAHSADDQVETVLHHLFRGSAMAGLAGIPRSRPLGADVILVRPLLPFPKNQLHALLGELGQPWREDATNQTSDYQRNWLRNELLPTLRTRYPEVDAAILRASRAAAAAKEHWDVLAEEWRAENILEEAPHRIKILRSSPPDNRPWNSQIAIHALVRLWDHLQWPRRDMNQQHWGEIWKMIASGSPLVHNLPGALRASATPSTVVVERSVLD